MTDDEWERHSAEVNAGVLYEYRWFDRNRDEIIAGHHGEQVVISGHKVVGYFKDNEAAHEYVWANNMKPGNYAIQDCVTREEEERMTFAVWR
jgi:hypothetical protein